MPFSVFGKPRVLFVLLLLFHPFSTVANKGKVSFCDPGDWACFYKECEALIRSRLEKVELADIKGEVPLTRVFSTKATSSFYPQNKVRPKQKLFSWRSKNPRVVDDLIVLSPSELGNTTRYTKPFDKMGGMFLVLKSSDESLEMRDPGKKMELDYYAMIAYVRLGKKRSLDLEWDRWSLKQSRRFWGREVATQAAKKLPATTFLCAYGSCSCTICQCEGKTESYKKDVRKISYGIGKSPSGQKTSQSNKTAVAIATSKQGRAHASSVGKNDGGSHSTADTKKNSAMAESKSSHGPSSSFANGLNASVAESSSRTGDVRSASKSSAGWAQSSSQSYAGRISAAAMNSAEYDSQEASYDDDAKTNDDDSFDAESLVRDTDKAFADAAERSEKTKIRYKYGMCTKEFQMENNLTLMEYKWLRNGSTEANDVAEMSNTEPIPLYQNPLLYGYDVEVGVNISVYVTGSLPGYVAAQESCCGLNQKDEKSIIYKFLRTFGHDCNPVYEVQIKRIEKALTDENMARIMKTGRLNVSELRDLTPMTLLTTFKEDNYPQSLAAIGHLYGNTTSAHFNKIVAILIHAAHYSSNKGYLHQIKILKGLALNCRNILSGIMLKLKKCILEGKTCTAREWTGWSNERRLIYGLYMFLKFAELRYPRGGEGEPVKPFVEFIGLHEENIGMLSTCKSRRVVEIARSRQ